MLCLQYRINCVFAANTFLSHLKLPWFMLCRSLKSLHSLPSAERLRLVSTLESFYKWKAYQEDYVEGLGCRFVNVAKESTNKKKKRKKYRSKISLVVQFLKHIFTAYCTYVRSYSPLILCAEFLMRPQFQVNGQGLRTVHAPKKHDQTRLPEL